MAKHTLKILRYDWNNSWTPIFFRVYLVLYKKFTIFHVFASFCQFSLRNHPCKFLSTWQQFVFSIDSWQVMVESLCWKIYTTTKLLIISKFWKLYVLRHEVSSENLAIYLVSAHKISLQMIYSLDTYSTASKYHLFDLSTTISFKAVYSPVIVALNFSGNRPREERTMYYEEFIGK